MITPQEIRKKAERKYFNFLQDIINDIPFSTLVIRGDKKYTKSSLREFEEEIRLLLSQSKEKKGFGYTLEFQQVKTKTLGIQDLPTLIFFDSELDLLKFLGKENEVELFTESVNKIIESFPDLKEWIIKNPKKIVANQTQWDSILKVCEYFTRYPKPNLYIRELPIQIHTKFLERNQSVIRELLDILILEHINIDERLFEKRFNLKYAESLVRFKILDKEISQKFFSGIDDMAIPISQFETLNLPVKRILIVENKTTLYTTLTLPKMDDTIAIFGSGYSVSNLKSVNWFNNIKVLYWGDIDVQGFEILSQFRGYFPKTKSILMDIQTFNMFFEDDLGTLSSVSTNLNLNSEEKELYNILKINNWRLEQEKIPYQYVNEYFEVEIVPSSTHI